MSSGETTRRIGLIAGNGRFPIVFAQEAKKNKCSVIAIAVKYNTSLYLPRLVDKVYWLDISEFQRIAQIFNNESIDKAVMAGQINPFCLFKNKILDNGNLSKFFSLLEDKRADTIFRAIADRLKERGITLLDSRLFMDDCIAKKGVLTAHQADERELEDIEFGFKIAKDIGSVDIGQTVVIKNKIVVAVEAIEGTDRTIIRAGQIAGKGCVVVKTSKPNQDMRFDIPLIGPKTINNLKKIKASCLAIEAGKTIIIDKDICVRIADKSHISLVCV